MHPRVLLKQAGGRRTNNSRGNNCLRLRRAPPGQGIESLGTHTRAFSADPARWSWVWSHEIPLCMQTHGKKEKGIGDTRDVNGT